MTTETDAAAALKAQGARVDGRRLRSEDSRRRIIAALLDLVQEGDYDPSAETVAERAGVGLRSVFRHFKDMESLRSEIMQRIISLVAEIRAKPFPGPTWRENLDEVIKRRAEAFEILTPFRLAGLAHRRRSQVVEANNELINHALRLVLVNVLPPEVVENKPALEALDMVMSMDAWIRLRLDQKLSPEEAVAVVRRLVATQLP